MKLHSLFLLSCCVFAISCKKFDNDPPAVELLTLNGSTDEIVLGVDQGYPFKYRVVDNKMISFIQFNVIKGFRNEQNVTVHPADYYYANGFNPDNEYKEETLPLDIPNNAVSGTYRLTVNAKDPNDNTATEKSVNFIIINPAFAPNVSANVIITGDNVGPVYDIRRGDRVRISGTATDNTDITRIKIDMLSANVNVFSKVITVPGSSDKQVDLGELTNDLVMQVPATSERGIYDLIISVTSQTGHTTPRVFKLNVIF